MAFEDILLSLTTYPESTKTTAIEDAVAFAAALESKISALACEVRVSVPSSPLGNSLFNVSAMVANEAKKSATHAKDALAAFKKLADAEGVLKDCITEKCLTSEVPGVIIDYARLRDMTIIPLPEADGVESWFAESLIFEAGRPVVVLPESQTWSRQVGIDTVIVAWDFSRNASRAVFDAMPILKKAKRVYILTVTNEKKIDTKRSGAELAKYLAGHGVNVSLDVVDAAGRRVDEVFAAQVTLRDANLLVMGAYGHSRLRELVLGGATRAILTRPMVPTFLSH
jgi:nucleotide-binding universal stress UspA family protein